MIDGKIALGTHNYLELPAMSRSQCEAAIDKGAQITEATLQAGCNCLGFGEMGIGNSSASVLLMSATCQSNE
ncbi:nicotinate-nucleotide--dimethylbenzimidazole phosphoribosyltransferase [Aliagarivorans marinus]|uniref:nicotinate-nucleotide--dimethylbenzimidazole phosphoribosyltransferase n=1 Tax=Aliagarivorans marinus TaxID=561965 RepID=UPI000424A082|nr:nicotinate-nucleotide--dimethylbenzimidazole phosphoribosyltransferase [Aliagarivorans marinus]